MRGQMATTPDVLTVVDVYDLASSIGKEFEKIIDGFGPEAVTDLMPKVISVLEHLEVLSNRNQKENEEVTQLQLAVERLTTEKIAKAEERGRYEKELEQIEDTWRTETKNLSNQIGKLQDENRKLRYALNEQEGDTAKEQQDVYEHMEAVSQLKDNIHKQCDEMRAMKRELSQKNADLEGMQSQLERLAQLNQDYRRKQQLTQRQAQHLIQDKAELEAQVMDKEQLLKTIKDKAIQEQDGRDSCPPGGPGSPRPASLSDEEFQRLEERLLLDEKMLIDLRDPNRPRYTLNELRDVLQERNELKTRVIELEEELAQYKPKPIKPSPPLDDSTGSNDGAYYDLPVHGPINQEPDDKLHPERKEESGIRKFFKFLTSPSKKQTTPRGKRKSVRVPDIQMDSVNKIS